MKILLKEKNIPILGDFADVEVGITTGANSFFTVPSSTVRTLTLNNSLDHWLEEIVRINSVIFQREGLVAKSTDKGKSKFINGFS